MTMKRSIIPALLATIVAASCAHAASDYLLEIDGIKGESSDSRHPGTIEIESFSWGANTASDSGGGGGGAGKVSLQDIHFTARLTKAGPQLFLATTGTNFISYATLFLRRTGGVNGEEEEYYQIKMQDVLVSSYSQSANSSASGGPIPTDQFTLNFEKISTTYIGPDGATSSGTIARVRQ